MGDHDLETPQSLGRSSDEVLRTKTTNSGTDTFIQYDDYASASRPESPLPGTPLSDSGAKPQGPAQKRRRVTRACDECRRKKIKCDGKQPCTHCTVYSYGQSAVHQTLIGFRDQGTDEALQTVHMIGLLTDGGIRHHNT